MSGQPNTYIVKLGLRDGRVTAVKIAQTHAVNAEQLVLGKPWKTAPEKLAQLLAVCAQAQTAAAWGAVEQALGTPADATAKRERATAVLRERVLNGLWRLTIDWPRALGREERPRLVADARRRLASDVPFNRMRTDLESMILEAAGIAATMTRAAAIRSRDKLADYVAVALDDPRRALDALSVVAAGGDIDSEWSGEAGTVRTSRGLLSHSARIENDVVRAYTIVTPTDRLMAKGGTIETALIGLGGDVTTRAKARIALLDPCAPFDLMLDSRHA